ncbi:MAG: hypothetical protein KJ574_00855 [Nanoarchaeota archaeon]|nr:hypothetical protein [Nanoarchaeota archaeon]
MDKGKAFKVASFLIVFSLLAGTALAEMNMAEWREWQWRNAPIIKYWDEERGTWVIPNNIGPWDMKEVQTYPGNTLGEKVEAWAADNAAGVAVPQREGLILNHPGISAEDAPPIVNTESLSFIMNQEAEAESTGVFIVHQFTNSLVSKFVQQGGYEILANDDPALAEAYGIEEVSAGEWVWAGAETAIQVGTVGFGESIAAGVHKLAGPSLKAAGATAEIALGGISFWADEAAVVMSEGATEGVGLGLRVASKVPGIATKIESAGLSLIEHGIEPASVAAGHAMDYLAEIGTSALVALGIMEPEVEEGIHPPTQVPSNPPSPHPPHTNPPQAPTNLDDLDEDQYYEVMALSDDLGVDPEFALDIYSNYGQSGAYTSDYEVCQG